MQLKFVSIHVKYQEKAIDFYTRVFGLKKMADNPKD
jgi:catechol 2,3-dioxygenase-like lactoylglutathione lyase family enzyme